MFIFTSFFTFFGNQNSLDYKKINDEDKVDLKSTNINNNENINLKIRDIKVNVRNWDVTFERVFKVYYYYDNDCDHSKQIDVYNFRNENDFLIIK